MGRLAEFLRRLSRAHRLGVREWGDLVCAFWELARANRRVHRVSAAQIVGDLRPRAGRWSAGGAMSDEVVARVAAAIARAAAVAPFRSDCLIQAEAARRWLARRGIPSDLRLGARGSATGGAETHAWLLCGDRIVTGGDVSGFSPFEPALRPFPPPRQ